MLTSNGPVGFLNGTVGNNVGIYGGGITVDIESNMYNQSLRVGGGPLRINQGYDQTSNTSSLVKTGK